MRLAILDCATWTDPSLDKYGTVGKLVTGWLQPHLPAATYDIIAIAHGAPFPAMGDYDGFILPGSEHGVYDDTPWMKPLATYLLGLRDAQKPLLGICFGHQMMAHTFGGHAAKANLGFCAGVRRWTVKDQVFDAMVLHQDQVLEAPPNAQVIGGADYCKNGVISYDFGGLSMQFHPEYAPEFVHDVIDVLDGDSMTAPAAEQARETMTRPVQRGLFGAQVATFFRDALG